MKLIENKVEEYIQESGINGIYKAIRDAAAICYQTDVDKMKLQTKEFVEQVLLKNGHLRPLEFGTVTLVVSRDEPWDIRNKIDEYILNKPWTQWQYVDDICYITTNMRVIMCGAYDCDKDAIEDNYKENCLDIVNKYHTELTQYHYPRRTFTMFASRGCTDDLRTHVSLSSMCESTRFCNYSKNKFNNELTFIKPYWITDDACEIYGEYLKNQYINILEELGDQVNFLHCMLLQERQYLDASKMNLQPQQLKRLFPLGVKAELRLCGFDDAWDNFFWRRCDEHADPECIIIANKIKELY